MRIEYFLADPTGNITLFVTCPCEGRLYRRIASQLMLLEPRAEQLGFLSHAECGADIDLYMSGGEFCGNAAMSAGAFVCRRRGLEKLRCMVKVSGTEEPVAVTVESCSGGQYSCKVEMPKPLAVCRRVLSVDGETREFDTVTFSGITHIISQGKLTRAQAENNIRAWCGELRCEALGIMLIEPEAHRISPLVYVAGIDSLFWESSCASGTSAVGVYLSRFGAVNETFSEPGGELSIDVTPAGVPILGGKVCFGEKKIADLQDETY